MILALGGCGLVPRVSTGNDVMDAVLSRVDPFGDCVTVGGQTTVFKPSDDATAPPGQLTAERFEDPEVRAAAAAIAISHRGIESVNEQQVHFGAGNADSCVMDLSAPAYSGDFAFVDYSEPGGAIGVYALRKDGSGWRVIEHLQLGNW